MSKKSIHFEKSTDQILKDNNFQINYYKTDFLNRFNERFDFTDEWNNLGFGVIRNDSSRWAISLNNTEHLKLTHVLGVVCDKNEKHICDYCGVKEVDGVATLWFNREAGPVDGLDNYLIEDFLMNYKTNEFGSEPILSEIPYGYKSAVTMRIDCDEDIASGTDLFNLYKNMNVPFSMAIKTSLEFNNANIKAMHDVIKAGGAVVSHSHTHAPNWGGSLEQAKWEAETARNRLKEVLPSDYTYDYVVSPFHQNPQYAVKGLVDAGIKGFVGGIIKNDPEYLQARAGYVSTGENIITHSQQCMLHGDCFHDTGLRIYKESFSNHYKTNTFFGFLDHPFSKYKYGWNTEEERVGAHKDFLKFIKSHDDVWYANLIDAMNFLWVKSNTNIWVEKNELKWSTPKHSFKIPNLKVFWKGEEVEIPSSLFN
jgi:hypothetical protein